MDSVNRRHKRPRKITLAKAAEALKAAYGLPREVRTPEPSVLAAVQKRYGKPYGLTLQDLEHETGVEHMKRVVSQVKREERANAASQGEQHLLALEKEIRSLREEVRQVSNLNVQLSKHLLRHLTRVAFTEFALDVAREDPQALAHLAAVLRETP